MGSYMRTSALKTMENCLELWKSSTLVEKITSFTNDESLIPNYNFWQKRWKHLWYIDVELQNPNLDGMSMELHENGCNWMLSDNTTKYVKTGTHPMGIKKIVSSQQWDQQQPGQCCSNIQWQPDMDNTALWHGTTQRHDMTKHMTWHSSPLLEKAPTKLRHPNNFLWLQFQWLKCFC